ncbi:M15 family metallopeptidase [Quatrionicoccus australiensis]|uniref:M15 family metallopeptidase n=1 Tax=Quatrionicoccus australiensis TaxID=138118 RepID=UPI001CF9CD74|nr:M15 family metallopeptidase [Quatrionicoccus australiensis]MCB4359516.1 M15 family metallopeptidase [Quatrionicoccus australiensis]
MVEFTLISYFLLIAICLLIVVFPDYRTRLLAAIGVVISNGYAPLSRHIQKQAASTHGYANSIINASKGSLRFLKNQPLLSGIALLMITAPALFALVIRGPTLFDFNDDSHIPDRRIAILLEGEQLAPPPSLPPDVFTTREVELIVPEAAFASRNWKQLDPIFTQRLLVAFKLMRERYGYEMALIEGYRSPERQAKLAALGSQVTQAGPYMSYHQFGLAADCAFFRDGKIVISEQDPWAMRGYELFGEIAEQVELTWGGRWKMRDLGHVELHRKGILGHPPPSAINESH